MARQVLENGVILPAEYSDDWYDDMTSNLTKLDDVIGSDSEKLSSSDVGAAALSNNYNDLDNLPTIPTVNDATLTIQKNGVDVQTFTANASSNVTANITVPTKTSDLTNDSNFVDTSNSAVASGITSAKVTSYDAHIADTDIHVTTADKTKWNNGVSQAYVFRYSSTALTASSTNSNTLLDNTDNLKVGDKVIDSSGVLFSITAIDTVNSTFTVGSALIDLALDANVVHTSGNETIGGNKEFTGTTKAHDVVPSATNSYNLGGSQYQWNNAYIKSLTINGVACGDILTHNVSEFVDVTGEQTIGGRKIFSHGQTGVGRDLYHFATFPYGKNTPPANTSYQYIWFSGNTTSQGFTDVWYGGYIEQVVNTNGSARGRWLIRDTSESALGIELFVDGNDKQFRPNPNNAVDLGTSTNKWKSFNGLTPSSLGMPDLSNGIDISSYIPALDGGNTQGSYTPNVNGFIAFRAIGNGGCSIVQGNMGNNASYVTDPQTSNRTINNFLPVVKNNPVVITAKGLTSLEYIYFYPCLGNV